MTDDQSSSVPPVRLSEDDAHRLLARAIELDHSRSAETSVGDLRAIAQEAGISAEAFDLALREIKARVPWSPVWSYNAPWMAVRGLWNRLRGRDASMSPIADSAASNGSRSATIWESVIANAVAVPLIWLLLFLLTRITQPIGWQAMEATILAGCVLGAGIARKLGARMVEVALTGFVAFQAAELVMHLLYGIRAVQGGPTHFAVMIAGVLGVAIGWRTGRRSGAGAVPAAPSTGLVGEGTAEQRSGEQRLNVPLKTLRLRTLDAGR